MKNGVDTFAKTIYNNFIHLSRTDGLEHNMKELHRLLSTGDMISYVVYDGTNKIVAYLVGETKHLNDGRVVYYISYIYVGKKYRGRKLGTQLINLVIKKCKQIGINFVTLTCDIADNKVYSFYEKMGFMPDPILRNYGKHEVLTLYL